jgi:dTDP-4-dehydrorhamnose 3,5-epimerase
MDTSDLSLSGLKLVRPRVFGDQRGFFLETFQAERYRAAGITCDFVQDSHSRSAFGVLRGLHYQDRPGQAKLVRVASGRIFDVAVDIRADSPTFGRWQGVFLDSETHHQLFIPVGFAHGFCVLSEMADVTYKVSQPYDAASERTLAWDDRDVGIAWPVNEPVLSERDRNGESLADFAARVGRPT